MVVSLSSKSSLEADGTPVPCLFAVSFEQAMPETVAIPATATELWDTNALRFISLVFLLFKEYGPPGEKKKIIYENLTGGNLKQVYITDREHIIL